MNQHSHKKRKDGFFLFLMTKEPVSSDVNEVCFEEEQDIPNACKKFKKIQSVTECYRCWKWDVMHTNVEYLSCGEVEALGYFQLLDMRYDDRNVVIERVSTTVVFLLLLSVILLLNQIKLLILQPIIKFPRRWPN